MSNCQYCGEPTGKKRLDAVFCKKCNKIPDIRVQMQRLRSETYRSRQKGIECDLTIRQWMDAIDYFSTFNEDGSRLIKCVYCGQSFESKHIGVDHYIPIISRSKTTASNCVPACTLCNVMKGVLTGKEFLSHMGNVWRSPQAIDSYTDLMEYFNLKFQIEPSP
jgi:5-methylcytosine-specific restriction endonuclease McrA